MRYDDDKHKCIFCTHSPKMPSLSAPIRAHNTLPQERQQLFPIQEKTHYPEETFLTSLPTQPYNQTQTSDCSVEYSINDGLRNHKLFNDCGDIFVWHPPNSNSSENGNFHILSDSDDLAETTVNIVTSLQPQLTCSSSTPRAVYQLPARPIWRKANSKFQFYKDANYLQTSSDKCIESRKKAGNVQIFQENCTNSALPAGRNKNVDTNITPYRNNFNNINSHPGTPYFSKRSGSFEDRPRSQTRTNVTKTSLPTGRLSSSIVQVPLIPSEQDDMFVSGDASFLNFSGKVYESGASERSGTFMSFPKSNENSFRENQQSEVEEIQNGIGSVKGSCINLNHRSQTETRGKSKADCLNGELNGQILVHQQQTDPVTCFDASNSRSQNKHSAVKLPTVEEVPEENLSGNGWCPLSVNMSEQLAVSGHTISSISNQTTTSHEQNMSMGTQVLPNTKMKMVSNTLQPKKLSNQEACQILKWHIKHLFQADVNGTKYALWSDIQDIMFPNCKPGCEIALKAVQDFFQYPHKTDSLLKCTEELCKRFSKQFYHVPQNSFLVNVVSLESCKMTLWNLVKRIHSETENDCWKYTCLNRGSKSDTILCENSKNKDNVHEYTTKLKQSAAAKTIIRTSSDEMIKTDTKQCDAFGNYAKPAYVLNSVLLPDANETYHQYFPLNEVVQSVPSVGVNMNIQKFCKTIDQNNAIEYADGDPVICCPRKYVKSIGRGIVARNGWGGNWMHITPNTILIRSDVASEMINEAPGKSKTITKQKDDPLKLLPHRQKENNFLLKKRTSEDKKEIKSTGTPLKKKHDEHPEKHSLGKNLPQIKNPEVNISDHQGKCNAFPKVLSSVEQNIFEDENLQRTENWIKNSNFLTGFESSSKSGGFSQGCKAKSVEKCQETKKAFNSEIGSSSMYLARPNSVVRAVQKEQHEKPSAVIGKALCSGEMDIVDCDRKNQICSIRNKTETRISPTDYCCISDKQKSSEESLVILRQSRSTTLSKDDSDIKSQPRQSASTSIPCDKTTANVIQNNQLTPSKKSHTTTGSSDSETYQSNIKVVIKKVKKKKYRPRSKSASRQEVVNAKINKHSALSNKNKQHTTQLEFNSSKSDSNKISPAKKTSEEGNFSVSDKSPSKTKHLISQNKPSVKSKEHKSELSHDEPQKQKSKTESSNQKIFKLVSPRKNYPRKSKTGKNSNKSMQSDIPSERSSTGNFHISTNIFYKNKRENMKPQAQSKGIEELISTKITDDIFKQETVENLPKYNILKSEVVNCFKKEMSQMTESLKAKFYQTAASVYGNENELNNVNSACRRNIKNASGADNKPTKIHLNSSDLLENNISSKKSKSDTQHRKEVNSHNKKKVKRKNQSKSVSFNNTTLIEQFPSDDINDCYLENLKHDFNTSNNFSTNASIPIEYDNHESLLYNEDHISTNNLLSSLDNTKNLNDFERQTDLPPSKMERQTELPQSKMDTSIPIKDIDKPAQCSVEHKNGGLSEKTISNESGLGLSCTNLQICKTQTLASPSPDTMSVEQEVQQGVGMTRDGTQDVGDIILPVRNEKLFKDDFSFVAGRSTSHVSEASPSADYPGQETELSVNTENNTIQVLVNNCGRMCEYEAVPQFSVHNEIHSDASSHASLPSYASIFSQNKNTVKKSVSPEKMELTTSLVKQMDTEGTSKSQKESGQINLSSKINVPIEECIAIQSTTSQTNRVDICVQVDFDSDNECSDDNIPLIKLSLPRKQTCVRKCKHPLKKAAKPSKEHVKRPKRVEKPSNVSTLEAVYAPTNHRLRNLHPTKINARKTMKKQAHNISNRTHIVNYSAKVRHIGIQCKLKVSRHGNEGRSRNPSRSKLLSKYKAINSKEMNRPSTLQTSDSLTKTQPPDKITFSNDLIENRMCTGSILSPEHDSLPQLNTPRRRSDSKFVFTFPIERKSSDTLPEMMTVENTFTNNKSNDVLINGNINDSTPLHVANISLLTLGQVTNTQTKDSSSRTPVGKFRYSHRQNSTISDAKILHSRKYDIDRKLNSEEKMEESHSNDLLPCTQNIFQCNHDADNESGMSNEDISLSLGVCHRTMKLVCLKPFYKSRPTFTAHLEAHGSFGAITSTVSAPSKTTHTNVSPSEEDDIIPPVGTTANVLPNTAFYKNKLNLKFLENFV